MILRSMILISALPVAVKVIFILTDFLACGTSATTVKFLVVGVITDAERLKLRRHVLNIAERVKQSFNTHATALSNGSSPSLSCHALYNHCSTVDVRRAQ